MSTFLIYLLTTSVLKVRQRLSRGVQVGGLLRVERIQQ
jgi:hypothetical protein